MPVLAQIIQLNSALVCLLGKRKVFLVNQIKMLNKRNNMPNITFIIFPSTYFALSRFLIIRTTLWNVLRLCFEWIYFLPLWLQESSTIVLMMIQDWGGLLYFPEFSLSFFNIKNNYYIFYMYVHFACMHICSRCGFSAYSGHKRASYPLELKLKVTVRVLCGCWKD